jgi:hypothetical protein
MHKHDEAAVAGAGAWRLTCAPLDLITGERRAAHHPATLRRTVRAPQETLPLAVTGGADRFTHPDARHFRVMTSVEELAGWAQHAIGEKTQLPSLTGLATSLSLVSNVIQSLVVLRRLHGPPPEAGRRGASVITPGEALRRPVLHTLSILPRSRQRPVVSTEGKRRTKVNKTGVRLWT